MTELGPACAAIAGNRISGSAESGSTQSTSKGSLLDRLHRALRTDSTLMPFGATVGFSIELVRDGEAIVSLETGAPHENIVGYTHGGVLFTIADTAIGLAHLGTLNENETATTVEVKINYLRPAWHTRLRAHARMVKRGQLLSLVECDIFDREDRLIARATGTMMTVPEDKTSGRSEFRFDSE